jgi:hypothetical protein
MRPFLFLLVFTLACEVRLERPKQGAPLPKNEATKSDTISLDPSTTPVVPDKETPTKQVEAATLDYIKNGLAGVWDGRITKSEDLMRWFVPGEESVKVTERIITDQGHRTDTLNEALVTAVRLSATMTEAESDYVISVTKTGVIKCYSGTQKWIQQPDGHWLRTAVSMLKELPVCSGVTP